MYLVTIRTEISGYKLPAADAPSALTIVRSIEAQQLRADVFDERGRAIPRERLQLLAARRTR